MKKKLDWILLVDDNDSDNFLHKRLISKAGITDHIFITMHGREALDLLTTHAENGRTTTLHENPGLIFLDLNMPVMDGWEFLEKYRESVHQQKPDNVIIILTTSINPADKSKSEQLLEPGCFLYKPLTLEMVLEVLDAQFPEYV